jgi:hypothetical protein
VSIALRLLVVAAMFAGWLTIILGGCIAFVRYSDRHHRRIPPVRDYRRIPPVRDYLDALERRQRP